MSRSKFRLWIALFASLLLHFLLLLPELLQRTSSRQSAPAVPLQAKLSPLPAPELHLDKPLPQTVSAKPPGKPAARPIQPTPDKIGKRHWVQQVREHLQRLDQQGALYPLPSIQAGEQGDAQVLIILDESGNVVAARIEQSSRFPRLDEAALRAVRSLHALPNDAPREAIIPVRFRLR